MPLNSDWLRTAAWACLLVLGATVIWRAVQGHWTDVGILGVFAAATLVFMLARERLPALFSFLFAVAALINAAGFAFGLYEIPGYDPFSHGYTTFAATLAAGFLTFFAVRGCFIEHLTLFVVTLACFGATLGAFWEIFEYSLGVGQTYWGVVQDLILDISGATLASLLTVGLIRREPDWRLPRAEH